MTGRKPQGYNSLSPYLISADAKATVEFLKQAFDGVELRRYERPDGSIMHIEIRLDDTVVMIGGANNSVAPTAAHVHLYVRDVDAVYQKALRYGAVSVQEPAIKGD